MTTESRQSGDTDLFWSSTLDHKTHVLFLWQETSRPWTGAVFVQRENNNNMTRKTQTSVKVEGSTSGTRSWTSIRDTNRFNRTRISDHDGFQQGAESRGRLREDAMIHLCCGYGKIKWASLTVTRFFFMLSHLLSCCCSSAKHRKSQQGTDLRSPDCTSFISPDIFTQRRWVQGAFTCFEGFTQSAVSLIWSPHWPRLLTRRWSALLTSIWSDLQFSVFLCQISSSQSCSVGVVFCCWSQGWAKYFLLWCWTLIWTQRNDTICH